MAGVEIRHCPYPYRAMLALCSDLDETPDRQVYYEIARFLNTHEETAMGRGVGLEVGNTIYFDMPPDQFAYWNTDNTGREMVRAMIHSGHIDCLHSYGDLAVSREHAGRALEELSRFGCSLECWVDHARSPTNFGADIMHGYGDVPGHPAYHADLTRSFGIKYVWRGRVTSVIGQDRRPCWQGVFDLRHPAASTRTITKELAKHVLARRGNPKYAMHGPNKLLRPIQLRDGWDTLEFLRCNPHWGGLDEGETADGLAEMLVPRFLRRLVKRRGCCILYTHLGKIHDSRKPLGPATVHALQRLAEEYHEGRILVTTTQRLLKYRHAVRQLSVPTPQNRNETTIAITTRSGKFAPNREWSKDDLAGLTLYVDEVATARISIDGQEVTNLQRNAPDETGRPSVSLPWPRLEFPTI